MASEQPVIIAKNFRSQIGARYFSSWRNLKKFFRDDFIFDSQSLSIWELPSIVVSRCLCRLYASMAQLKPLINISIDLVQLARVIHEPSPHNCYVESDQTRKDDLMAERLWNSEASNWYSWHSSTRFLVCGAPQTQSSWNRFPESKARPLKNILKVK